jgi:hypothetical protein
MEAMSITSDARADRATRVLREALRSTLAAGLFICALIVGSATASYAQSGPLVNDPLIDPNLSTSWPQAGEPGSAGNLAAFYSDDGYHLTSDTNHMVAVRNEHLDTGANQSIEVDATLVGDGDLNFGTLGVSCRTTVTGGYFFGTDSVNNFRILKKISDGSMVQLALQAAPGGRGDPEGTTYHLRGDCNGSQLAMFVNGDKVLEAQDGDYKAGSVGLFVSTQGNTSTGIDVAFTNLSISRP